MPELRGGGYLANWPLAYVAITLKVYFLKLITQNSHLVTHCKIALHRALLSNKSTLIQVMAWCQQATSHYLIQCWHWSTLPFGITQPQWVNSFMSIDAYILVSVGYHWFRWWNLICWVPNHFLINLLAKYHYSSGPVGRNCKILSKQDKYHEYSMKNRSMPLLLITWHLVSPGHGHPCEITKFLT